MADETIWMNGPRGPRPIKIVDNGDGTFSLSTTASVTLGAGDFEVGAVEIKNSSDDTRATVNAANTARATSTPVLVTQSIDAAGNVVGGPPASAALSDATANPTTPSMGAYLQVFNGTTWDRIRSAISDAMAATGLQALASMLWNGATWDRQPGNTSGSFVQGNVASGIADAGNPIGIGGVGSSATPSAVTTGQRVKSWFGTSGQVVVSPVGVSTMADGSSAVTGLAIGPSGSATAPVVALAMYNNATLDRQRNNHEVALLASAARAIDTNSADQTNYNARGVIVTVDVTVLGSTNLTFTIKYKDTLSGKYVTLLASSALVGTGTTSLTVYPGTTISANLDANAPLPRVWRVEVVRGGAPGTDTYSVSANYIN